MKKFLREPLKYYDEDDVDRASQSNIGSGEEEKDLEKAHPKY